MSQARYSLDEWRRVFQRQRTSGLSVTAFCAQSRIPTSSFFLWRRKLRSAAGFAEVKIASDTLAEGRAAAETSAAASPIEVRLTNGRCLGVRPGFCRRTLLELLAALEDGA
jgi:hypothetical protein